MKRLCVALAGLCVVGCAGVGQGVPIRVPVPIACAEPVPERPAMPTDGLAPGVDLFTFTVTAQAEIEVREGYEGRLLNALDGCRRPVTVTPERQPRS
jgi:hypothetical protein